MPCAKVFITTFFFQFLINTRTYLRNVREPGNLIPTLWSHFGADFSKMLPKMSLKFEFWSQVPSLLKQLSQVCSFYWKCFFYWVAWKMLNLRIVPWSNRFQWLIQPCSFQISNKNFIIFVFRAYSLDYSWWFFADI